LLPFSEKYSKNSYKMFAFKPYWTYFNPVSFNQPR